jgi:hypothetical protein
MTPREGFRFGFYYRCAEEGLTVDQARDRARFGLEKCAQGGPSFLGTIGSGLGTGLGYLGTGLKHLGGLAVLGGVGVPAAAGTAIGLGLAHAQERDVDPEDIRQQELISAYRFHAEQARRRSLMKRLQAGGRGPLGGSDVSAGQVRCRAG